MFLNTHQSPVPLINMFLIITSVYGDPHWGLSLAFLDFSSAAVNAASDGKKCEFREDSLPIDIKLPVKQVISRELQVKTCNFVLLVFPVDTPFMFKVYLCPSLQLYFDKIRELTLSRSGSVLFKHALLSLATDSGLHPLVPYFTHFISDEVSSHVPVFSPPINIRALLCCDLSCFSFIMQVPSNLSKIPVLFALMRIVRSILQNPHIHIEPYVSYFLRASTPSTFSCAWLVNS